MHHRLLDLEICELIRWVEDAVGGRTELFSCFLNGDAEVVNNIKALRKQMTQTVLNL